MVKVVVENITCCPLHVSPALGSGTLDIKEKRVLQLDAIPDPDNGTRVHALGKFWDFPDKVDVQPSIVGTKKEKRGE